MMNLIAIILRFFGFKTKEQNVPSDLNKKAEDLNKEIKELDKVKEVEDKNLNEEIEYWRKK